MWTLLVAIPVPPLTAVSRLDPTHPSPSSLFPVSMSESKGVTTTTTTTKVTVTAGGMMTTSRTMGGAAALASARGGGVAATMSALADGKPEAVTSPSRPSGASPAGKSPRPAAVTPRRAVTKGATSPRPSERSPTRKPAPAADKFAGNLQPHVARCV